MTGFHAWLLPEETDARRVESIVATALAQAHTYVRDGVLMSWARTRRRPSLRTIENVARTAALGDAFWGWSFGALFFAAQPDSPDEPEPRQALHSATLTRVGFSVGFSAALRCHLKPGTGAIVLLCGTETAGGVDAALATHSYPHVTSPVSDAQLHDLHDLFTP